MKKIVIGLISTAVILGGGTLAFADSNGNGEGLLNFGQMKPFIEEMHPNLSTQEQKQMFDACHGEDGSNQDTEKDVKNMMNNI